MLRPAWAFLALLLTCTTANGQSPSYAEVELKEAATISAMKVMQHILLAYIIQKDGVKMGDALVFLARRKFRQGTRKLP